MTDTPQTRRLTRRTAFLVCSAIGLILAGLGWILVSRSEASAGALNEKCPVVSGRAASSKYQIAYKNKEIRFCCNECVTEFLSYPEEYESQVPQLQNQPLGEKIQVLFDTYRWFAACAALALTLAGLILYRLSTKRQPAGTGRPSLFNRKVPLSCPLLILTGFLGWQAYTSRAELSAKNVEDDIHFATMHDFGTPPVPFRPPLKPRVKAEFYRGNDERNPRLFNNGNYRTATFLVSLRDGQGQELDHGAATGGQELLLRLEIVRPRFTPDFLFSDKIMGKMFLTQEFDKFLGRDKSVADEVPFTTVEKMQRWQAEFPLGRVAAEGEESKRGLVYLCETYHRQDHWWNTEPVRWGSRFHYGISYDLTFKDGRLTADSDLSMGSLYRTRKFSLSLVPREQWFSHEEIPLLPRENVQDPKLLGIDDYR